MSAELLGLDGVPFSNTLLPQSAAQVAEALASVRADGLAVVATGGATKLGWGNVARAKSLVRLDLTQLSSVLEIDADEGIATVSAGVRVADLERAAREAGKCTRLPALHGGATVGGTIASDALAPEQSQARRLRDDLLGMQVALPNGEVTKSGGRVMKNVTGFDLVRLYCGSFGTLGIVTETTLRLWPLPEARRVYQRSSARMADALELAASLAEQRVDPLGVAILPEPEGVRLVWAVEGSQVDAELRGSRVAADRAGEVSWSEVQRAVAGAESDSADQLRVRVSGRSTDVRAILAEIEAVGGSIAALLPTIGVLLAEIPQAGFGSLLASATSQRWALLVERGSAKFKAGIDVFGPEPSGIELMRALKRQFDPGCVLAPGRFVGGL